MTIRSRLILVMSGLLLVAVTVGLTGLYGLERSSQALKSVYQDRTKALDNVNAIMQMMQRMHLSISSSLLDPTDVVMKFEQELIVKNLADTASFIADFQASNLTPEERQIAGRLSQARANLVKQGIEPAVKALGELNLDGASQLLKSKVVPLLKAVTTELSALRLLQVEGAKLAYDQSAERYRSIQIVMVVTIAIAAIATAIAGAALIRSLYRELGGEPAYSGEVVRRIAAGDLTATIAIKSSDETSLLFAMKTMQAKLSETVSGIRKATELVASSSSEIAQGNVDISQRTEQQANALTHVVQSLQCLTEMVARNTENAQQVVGVAGQAQAIAIQGNDVVRRVETTMQAINTSASEIADITGVIDGIAFQTNILALNAAVEAARAGEQGRGFAVVAAEVRSLAQRSAAAAKEIKQLIDQSSKNAENGSLLVAEAAGTMDGIQSAVARVAALMGEMTSSSQEQAIGIAEVNGAIAKVDAITHQNASLVVEVAAAASSLEQRASVLSHDVAFFKIDRSTPTAPVFA